jgi:hypothetical protein
MKEQSSIKIKTNQLKFESFDNDENFKDIDSFNKENLLQIIKGISDLNDLHKIKKQVIKLENWLLNQKENIFEEIGNEERNEAISFRKDTLISELEQILKSQTFERAKYYLKRLENSLQIVRTGKINDLNLARWKEYENIITDSLWILEKRDTSGAHFGWYWGNFVPQIPHQMMLRYTKKGDWIFDPFVGSGTTLIECKRLGRNGIGIELNPEVAQKAKELIDLEPNKYNVITDVIVGDSRTFNFDTLFENYRINEVQLIIMHPPYHDIIKFSNDGRDLSNAKNIGEFLKMFGDVVENTTQYLEKDRFLVLVIGDKYSKGEWIPLGFYCMEEVLKRGYLLKSIIVKNFEDTRGKREQKELWRYRALVGGFYIFKHEYIFLFQKK